MFVFNRSAIPVLIPLALLVAVVLWSNRPATPADYSAGVVTTDHNITVAQATQPSGNGS
jgi:hypothetical protein